MTATIGQLPAAAGAVGADLIEIEVAAGASSRKITLAQLLAAVGALIDHGALTGLADDDHPQYHTNERGDARYARLTGATFTGDVISTTTMYVDRGDAGASYGGLMSGRRNSNPTTPAPGAFASQKTDAGMQYLYSDDAGVWRTTTGAPTNANYATGAVVGAQTSHLAAKRLMGGESNVDDVLAAVRQGAAAVRRFVYKDGRYGGESFEGVVTDYAPRYGMDGGRALNEVTAIGDLLRAVAWCIERIAALEAQRGDA